MGLAATTWVPMGAQVGAQMITQTHPKGDKQVSETVQILTNSWVTLNSLNNNNFGAFGGAMAQATWA